MSREARAKLARLHRLEKVRAVAKRTAMLEAAAAEGTLGQLRALSERTQAMAQGYASRTDMADGASLVRLGAFVSGLNRLVKSTEHDTQRAQNIADSRMKQLGEAERRRAAVEERAQLQARLIARTTQPQVLGGMRKSSAEESGTDRE
ncbi:hypothetical protein [Novosphingobium sp. 9]|uniref:hypothetical protein n=1 Tax=Novosphingobium sp. 9 TaxID=2025349 RepID=UPI0021B5AE1F|nr:hypothetical protein [Novosphingobium sp. 9]